MSFKEPVVIAPYSTSVTYERLLSTLLPTLPRDTRVITQAKLLEGVQGHRLIFAIALDDGGLNAELSEMYEHMSRDPALFADAIAVLCVAGNGELYTKSTARELVFRANQAACTFLGRCLVEATASLKNFELRAQLLKSDLPSAWRFHVRKLIEGLRQYEPPLPSKKPNLLVLYSTNRFDRANTVRLWDMVASHLDPTIQVDTYNIGKGQVYDCLACKYERCHRLGCPYPDLMTEEIHARISQCDGLVFLCPNLNDSVGPDLSAVINRLTYLSNTGRIAQQVLYAVIVSGYSGGDLLARQLLNALCLNKNFKLPPAFAFMETANRPLSIMEVPNIQEHAAAYAARINRQLLNLI